MFIRVHEILLEVHQTCAFLNKVEESVQVDHGADGQCVCHDVVDAWRRLAAQ